MTQTAFTRAETLDQTGPAGVVEHQNGQHLWRIARGHVGLIESGRVDWFHLECEPSAKLVKRNTQRDVWRVTCGDQTYFAKVYHPNGLAARIKLWLRGPTALREWGVGIYAAAHNIGAVAPVATAWSGSRGDDGPSLLITEAIPDVEPLSEYWLRIRDDLPRSNLLIESLARLIARAHQCGFQHRDMHPGNILVRPVGQRSEIFFVDLHNMRVARAVSMREIAANLAQLNQWFRRHATRTQRLRLLRHYMAYRDRFAQASAFARNWRIEPASLVADLTVQAERHANKLWSKRDRRTWRDGRYFTRIRPAPGWRGHVLLQSKHPSPTASAARVAFTHGQWMEWLRDPLQWADPQYHELVKDSHTATICKGSLFPGSGAGTVIAKRPLARNFWKRLGQMFGPSRNMRSWKIANMLLNRDLPVAQPLAVVERYALGIIRLDSVAITDYINASADLETFLTRDLAALDAARQRRAKDRLIQSVVRLLKAFHDRGFVHRDCKAPNILVTWLPPYLGWPKLTLIDMDGISHVRRPSERQRTRAIVRLCASLLGSPACTRTDRLRFLRSYLLRPGGPADDWKNHWRIIAELVGSKLHDKETRRLWKLERYGRE